MMKFKDYIEMQNTAHEFAKDKHSGQKRKDGRNYIVHPESVAEIVYDYTEDNIIKSIAYLHDTLEDTNTTYAELKYTFGTVVADAVMELTSDESVYKKNGVVDRDKKAAYLVKKFNNMSDDAKTVKLADRLDNVSDHKTMSDKWKQKYKYETELILKGITSLSPIQKQIANQIQTILNQF